MYLSLELKTAKRLFCFCEMQDKKCEKRFFLAVCKTLRRAHTQPMVEYKCALRDIAAASLNYIIAANCGICNTVNESGKLGRR